MKPHTPTPDRTSGQTPGQTPVQTVGAYEAKTRFSHLLERVAEGEAFTITRHGRVVARLIPDESCQRERVESAVESLLALRGGVKGTTLAEALSWRDEGRM